MGAYFLSGRSDLVKSCRLYEVAKQLVATPRSYCVLIISIRGDGKEIYIKYIFPKTAKYFNKMSFQQ